LGHTADYIQEKRKDYGYSVAEFSYGDQQFRNISAEKTGMVKPDEISIVSANYDTEIRAPGVDDASGGDAVLEIA